MTTPEPVTPAPSERDRAIARALSAELAPLLRARPTASCPDGLAVTRSCLVAWLHRLGFAVHTEETTAGAPVVVATRSGRGPRWLGLSAHYDIEEEGDGWTVAPFEISLRDDRMFGRGTADNLGPLLLRLMALEALGDEAPGLVLVLQGEEEIGSPTAHALYPTLDLPAADLWLEETGYFELDGTQRMLLRRPNATVAPWISAAVREAARHGRSVETHDRYLNKAFGEHRCPFLTHLVGDAPYLAIGPNDPRSRIHAPDESLPIANLAVSWDQFQTVLRTAAEAA